MTTLTVQQTAAVLRKAGWPEVLIPTMVAIAKVESGLRPDAVNTANRNGTIDRGLLQINSSHTAYDPAKLLSDPVYNAKAGLAIYHAQTLDAWSSWKYGRVTPKAINQVSAELANSHDDHGGVIPDSIGDAVGRLGDAIGAVPHIPGAAAGAAKDAVGGVLGGLAGEVLKVGLMLVLVAAGAGLVVLGVNAAASSSKTVRDVKADAASLAPLALA